MIKSLHIKDFALIDELEIEFFEGLNILTGQTGAGKSIIIGALNMVLGERADTEVIRSGSKKAIAEATVAIGGNAELKTLLAEEDIEFGDYLVLRREIRDTGSRAFINDHPVTISILKKVGDQLVDLHGQHDHQLLLKEENHLGVLDSFGEIKPFLENYRKAYEEMKSLQKAWTDLKKRENELNEKLELYHFQVKELDEANLTETEEEELEAEMNLLDNAEELDQKAAAISEMSGEDFDLIQLLNELKINLEDLARIEPDFNTYLEEVTAARISIQEAIHFAERYRNRIEHNPQRLESLRRRQSELNALKKKYRKEIPELIEYLNEIRRELNLAENFDLELEKIDSEISKQSEVLARHAMELHNQRQNLAEKLSRDIEGELEQLGIPNATIRVYVNWLLNEKGWIEVDGSRIECTETGCDDVKIYISTNKGEEPKALAKIASGGEISRVMLALKSILAKEQSLPVMVFDEIDTGISGHISVKVGRSMRRLGSYCQILAITHQPQIASQADEHFKVEKVETGERTITRIVHLSDEDHIREVAGLMSGENISEAALESARNLIQQSASRN
jgi:DNA repair protein RecN (Recombination protein N)